MHKEIPYLGIKNVGKKIYPSFYIFGYLLQLRIKYDRFKELIINYFSIWQIFALKTPDDIYL